MLISGNSFFLKSPEKTLKTKFPCVLSDYNELLLEEAKDISMTERMVRIKFLDFSSLV